MPALTRAAAVVVGVLLAACGVPVQDAPTLVPEAVLPEEPRTGPVPAGSGTVDLYFVATDVLQPVPRQVEDASLQGALSALLDGPTAAELDGGFRTAIRPGTALRSVSSGDGVATVDVGRTLLDVTGPEQIIAVAQVVFTATGVAGTRSVRLVVQGQPVEVPLPDGTLTPAPVTRADYAPLAPPAS